MKSIYILLALTLTACGAAGGGGSTSSASATVSANILEDKTWISPFYSTGNNTCRAGLDLKASGEFTLIMFCHDYADAETRYERVTGTYFRQASKVELKVADRQHCENNDSYLMGSVESRTGTITMNMSNGNAVFKSYIAMKPELNALPLSGDAFQGCMKVDRWYNVDAIATRTIL